MATKKSPAKFFFGGSVYKKMKAALKKRAASAIAKTKKKKVAKPKSKPKSKGKVRVSRSIAASSRRWRPKAKHKAYKGKAVNASKGTGKVPTRKRAVRKVNNKIKIMTYKRKDFDAYDKRQTAQGARQQEGSSPAHLVDDESGALTGGSEGSEMSNDAGFNANASVINKGVRTNTKQKSLTEMFGSNINEMSKLDQSSDGGASGDVSPEGKAGGSIGQGSIKRMGAASALEAKMNKVLRFKKPKLNSIAAASKTQSNPISTNTTASNTTASNAPASSPSSKGGGNALSQANIQPINQVLGVNLSKNA